MERAARAEALMRAMLSLSDAGLRAAYMGSLVRAWDLAALARALDGVCERAEQAEARAREALVAIVDALNAEGTGGVAQALREEAASGSLLALERLIRHPLGSFPMRATNPTKPPDGARREGTSQPSPERGLQVAGVPSDARGRPLTLGERKSLARRPDRDTLQRLFADPHPDVMRRLLRNPRLTEDDVVRLAAKRPGRGEVLAEIAREIRWVHRPRVRMALVMNPATPVEMAARIAGLLLRPELETVVRSPGVPAVVRAVCVEHLERRPPTAQRVGQGGGLQ
jgi:hypothetical protein